ncbi:c-type cytochrome [Methylobacterium sp. NMS14P]|uniref:c-type cytochrome n=1 Tax=Methylobacterium sp. NMS14P TaxID=2894310 RepID=UPI0023583658|nr:c-type cytochrome [Methylobacterium sp. NMS14P]WCS22984.1 c-type cytochrome [Methylobacterium sp. NMS14P]
MLWCLRQTRPRILRRPARIAALALALLAAACSDDGRERRRALGETPKFDDVMRVADAERGGRLFGQCAACHTISPGAGDRNGPGLYDVLGKPVASNSRRYGYTGALRSLGGVWTPERMDLWLAAPAKLAPGTSMSFPGLPDPLDRADLIAYLRTQSSGEGDAEAPPTRP